MPSTLVIVRHGESTWNAKNLFTGWVDVNLSEKGEAEARQDDSDDPDRLGDGTGEGLHHRGERALPGHGGAAARCPSGAGQKQAYAGGQHRGLGGSPEAKWRGRDISDQIHRWQAS